MLMCVLFLFITHIKSIKFGFNDIKNKFNEFQGVLSKVKNSIEDIPNSVKDLKSRFDYQVADLKNNVNNLKDDLSNMVKNFKDISKCWNNEISNFWREIKNMKTNVRCLGSHKFLIELEDAIYSNEYLTKVYSILCDIHTDIVNLFTKCPPILNLLNYVKIFLNKIKLNDLINDFWNKLYDYDLHLIIKSILKSHDKSSINLLEVDIDPTVSILNGANWNAIKYGQISCGLLDINTLNQYSHDVVRFKILIKWIFKMIGTISNMLMSIYTTVKNVIKTVSPGIMLEIFHIEENEDGTFGPGGYTELIPGIEETIMESIVNTNPIIKGFNTVVTILNWFQDPILDYLDNSASNIGGCILAYNVNSIIEIKTLINDLKINDSFSEINTSVNLIKSHFNISIS